MTGWDEIKAALERGEQAIAELHHKQFQAELRIASLRDENDKLYKLTGYMRGLLQGTEPMITHDRITLTTPDQPVVFAHLLGISCSVCAPASMTGAAVERFADEHGPPASKGRWLVINKATLGMGSATPNPCNQVAGRTHWFLLSEEASMASRGSDGD